MKLFNNEAVPEHIVSPTAPMVGEDWKKFYDYDGKTRTHQMGRGQRTGAAGQSA